MVGGDKITYHDADDDEQEGYVYRFPRPSVTATVMLVHAESGTFFVGYRGEDVDAYPGAACLPGGFLEAKRDDHPGERVEQTAIRETLEEANISIDERDLNLLCVKSSPNTDPRAHVINVCYLVFVDDEQKEFAKAGDDLSGYDWRHINDIEKESGYAFNHYEIIIAGGRMAALSIQAQKIAKELKEVPNATA
jgi:ADP-ribose pyrophosphatase YjhB (NUDIX family)